MKGLVLLDVDGTLVDSNDAHARAWVAALGAAGYDVPFSTIRPLIGMGGDRILTHVDPALDAHEGRGKAITDDRRARFLRDELPGLRPQPGARALVEAIRATGRRAALATSAQPEELDPLLQVAGVADLVERGADASAASHSKPAPDIVAAALERAHGTADDAVLVGDTRWDVESGHRAGVAVVALRCGGNPPETLSAAEAVYADPAELSARLGDAPFAMSPA